MTAVVIPKRRAFARFPEVTEVGSQAGDFAENGVELMRDPMPQLNLCKPPCFWRCDIVLQQSTLDLSLTRIFQHRCVCRHRTIAWEDSMR